MLKTRLTASLLALTAAATQANNCDAIRAGIDARVRANGIVNHSLRVVDRAASAPGLVVGNCDQGAKKILMTQPGVAAPASGTASGTPMSSRREPRRSNVSDDILTECRDGSIVTGPDCSKTHGTAPPANPAAPNPELP